jgi:hypothetical protein
MSWWMWPLLAWLPLSALLSAGWHWVVQRSADLDEPRPRQSSTSTTSWAATRRS